MDVLACDPFNVPLAEIASADVLELASASDVVTLHVPLTDETHHLINKAFLDRVRRSIVDVLAGRRLAAVANPEWVDAYQEVRIQ
jgi:phosphoglycerate dehydrogenase-like enzyme